LIDSALDAIHGFTDELIRGAINNFMKDLARKITSVGSCVLHKFPIRMELEKTGLFLDYSLTNAPEIGADYAGLNLKGKVVDEQNHLVPFDAPEPAPFNHTPNMFYIAISDYFLNTFAYSAFNADLMKLKIDEEFLESNQPGAGKMLSTNCKGSLKCVGSLIKHLDTLFPEGTAVITVSAVEMPKVTFQEPNEISLDMVGDLNFQISLDNGSKIESGFVLRQKLKIGLNKLAFTNHDEAKGYALNAEVGTMEFGKFGLIETNLDEITPASVAEIEKAVELLGVRNMIKKEINHQIRKGIQIPTLPLFNITALNVQINGCCTLILSADLKFNGDVPDVVLPDIAECFKKVSILPHFPFFDQ